LLSAENARREAERKYRDIFENAVEGIFQTSPAGGFITANPALARMLGFESPEELIRARGRASGGIYYVHPERRVEFKRLLDEHDTVRGFEFEAYRKDGTKIWMSDNVRAVRDASGKLLYYEGTVEDITERKRAEAALQESEERFRQLSEAPFEAIILHDQGTILEVNQSFCRMYGYERAEVIGKSVLDLALPEFRELLLQKVRAGDTGSYEGPALRKDGTIFRAELAGKPIHYQGRTVRVAAIRDVTEQERNERRQAAQYAVTRVLAESATLAEAIPKLLQAICENLRWKMGEFWRVCDSTNLLRCVETWHVPGLDAASVIEPSHQTELAPGVGLLGRVWQSGQPAWIPDVATDPTFRRAAIAAKVGLHAALAFPIFLGSQTLGVMLFLSRRVRDVDEDLLKTMSAIGSQIGQFTERKRAEEALRESEVYFRSLIEHATDTISTYDANGVRLYTSPSIERVLGYEPEEMIGRSGFDLLHPDDRPLLASLFAQGVQIPGTKVTKELRCRHKDGTWRTLESTGSNLLGNPAVGAVVLNSRDITQRRRAEEALRESEERYRDLVENSREFICTHDLEGKILSANRAATQMLGYDPNELIGKGNIRNILAPEVRHQFDEYMARVHEDGATSGTMLVQTSSGERRVWEYYNSLRTEGVATPIVRGIARDITERKRSEESLRKQNEYLAALHETALGLINRLDLNELLEVIVTRACALVDIPSGYVYLIEPDGNEMSVKVGVGVSRDFVGARISKGQGVAGRIWQTGQPLVVDDYRNWEHRLTNAGYDVLRLVGAVPLRSGSRVIGVLGVESTEDGQGLDTEQIEILNRFAQLASIALDNAQLHSAVQQELAERKRTEEEVSHLRRELELTMNSMEEGIHRVDMHGNIAFENPAAARMLGWEVAELLGKPGHLTMHHTRPDGTPYPKEECPIYATIRDGVPRHGADEVFWRQDGSSFPVEYMTAPMRNDRNEIVATVVTFQDITERKRAEEVLRERDARLSAIYRAAPVGIGVDVNRVIQEVNDTMCSITGYSREELIGQDSRFLFPTQEEYERVGPEKSHVTAAHLPKSMTARLKRKDGRLIDVLLSAVQLDAADLSQGVTFTVLDVTESERAEAALRESEERYRELFENDKDAVYVHDLKGVYTSVNRAAERLSGYSRAEILGKAFRDFVSPEYLRQVGENLDRKLEELVETNYELEIINREGARVPVEVSSRLIYENGVAVGVQGSARDITERKRAQQALLTYSRRLLEAQEAERGRIARELHDQIGQMLTALKLNLHAIQAARDESEAQALIEDNLTMLDGALEQVRDLSVGLRPPLLDDLGLVTALHWYVDHQAQLTGVRAEFISDSLDSGLRFSTELETACFRIAQEALTNVARHARAKTVTVRLSRNRDYLILLIEDDGVGFDMEALHGHALASATLGLRGMQERAHAVGGRVKIDSATDKGTRVFVELPITLPNGRKPQLQNE
jgi:PAS domain S-box-containing protein